MTTIATPTDEVRALAQYFPITSALAADVARTQLLLALQVSMTDTSLYQMVAMGPLSSTTPESLAHAVPPRTLAAASLVLGELCTALGGTPTALDAMLYTDAWHPASTLTYSPASALAVELLPRKLDTAPTTTVVASAPAVHRLPPASVLIVPDSGQPGRPRKSPFATVHTARARVAAVPQWVDATLLVMPQVLRRPAADLVDVDRVLQPLETYALAAELLRRSLDGLDPSITVGGLQTWLEELRQSLVGAPCGAAVGSFVERVLSPKDGAS